MSTTFSLWHLPPLDGGVLKRLRSDTSEEEGEDEAEEEGRPQLKRHCTEDLILQMRALNISSLDPRSLKPTAARPVPPAPRLSTSRKRGRSEDEEDEDRYNTKRCKREPLVAVDGEVEAADVMDQDLSPRPLSSPCLALDRPLMVNPLIAQWLKRALLGAFGHSLLGERGAVVLAQPSHMLASSLAQRLRDMAARGGYEAEGGYHAQLLEGGSTVIVEECLDEEGESAASLK